jgi:hypothetical protein
MSASACTLSDLYFSSYCSAALGTWYTGYCGACTVSCSNWANSYFNLGAAPYKYWYYNQYTVTGCPDYEMRARVWENIFIRSTGNGYSTSSMTNGYYRQYMFCDKYGTTSCGIGVL